MLGDLENGCTRGRINGNVGYIFISTLAGLKVLLLRWEHVSVCVNANTSDHDGRKVCVCVCVCVCARARLCVCVCVCVCV
jgi:hypothetical protein